MYYGLRRTAVLLDVTFKMCILESAMHQYARSVKTTSLQSARSMALSAMMVECE